MKTSFRILRLGDWATGPHWAPWPCKLSLKPCDQLSIWHLPTSKFLQYMAARHKALRNASGLACLHTICHPLCSCWCRHSTQETISFLHSACLQVSPGRQCHSKYSASPPANAKQLLYIALQVHGTACLTFLSNIRSMKQESCPFNRAYLAKMTKWKEGLKS